jgi:hypothetical protein
VALSDQVARDAHAVFLPAIDEASIPSHIRAHLTRGGTSVLVTSTATSGHTPRSSSRARASSRWSVDWIFYSSLTHVTVKVPSATSKSPFPALNW